MHAYMEHGHLTFPCPSPIPPFIHSFIHSHSLWQWIWTSDWVRGGVKEWKGEGGREGTFFSSSKPTLWPHDLQTTLPSSCLLNSQLQTSTYSVFKIWLNMNISWMGRQKKWTHGHKSPHLPLFCLICYFCTLHSSTDGLSIDFDLFCLRLALCEYVLMWGGGCITTTLNTDLNSTGDCDIIISMRSD